MFCSKALMEFLPNIHLIGMFTMLFAIVFRFKALIPIYIFVFVDGIYLFLKGYSFGFLSWWIPYLYVWTILWAVTMLLPRKIPNKLAMIIYPIICALHGLSFGTLCAPTHALIFGLDYEQTIAWIVIGLPWDAVHAAGNFVAGLLIVPLSKVLTKLLKSSHILL